MSELDRLRAAPELYRARAQTTAGLATTAAAAITAGIAFGSAKLPDTAEVLVALVIGALLVSVAASVAASQFTEEREVENPDLPEELKRLTRQIRKRIRVSSVSGLVAMGLFLGLIVVVLFSDSPSSTWDVSVDDEAVSGLSQSCPGASDGLLRAQAQDNDVDDLAIPLRLEVTAKECGSEEDVSIRLDRSHVGLLVEVSS